MRKLLERNNDNVDPQAPESMRSVMQAIWLLTVAFGNLFFIIIAKAKAFEKQVTLIALKLNESHLLKVPFVPVA